VTRSIKIRDDFAAAGLPALGRSGVLPDRLPQLIHDDSLAAADAEIRPGAGGAVTPPLPNPRPDQRPSRPSAHPRSPREHPWPFARTDYAD
jgi:hypothetical protein